MKFVVSSSMLLARLQAVSRVISGKTPQPILENFLMETKESSLVVTASDKETTLKALVPLESVEEEGRIAIPAKLLLDMIREFPDIPLSFDINDDSQVHIRSDKGTYELTGFSADDYPVEAEMDPATAQTLSLSCGALLDGISKTIFATSNNDIRPVMNCILMEIDSLGAVFVASDGHKLVRYRRPDIKSESEEKHSVILPKKPALLLKGILPKDDTSLSLSFNDRTAAIVFGDYRLSCTLVEGRFPNYKSVIPTENNRKIVVDKLELYNALRRLSILANQSSSLVKFELSEKELLLTTQDVDCARRGQETISCTFSGEPIGIGFKAPFVLEILANLDTVFVEIQLSAPSRPGVFVPSNEAEEECEDLLMLLMPLMV